MIVKVKKTKNEIYLTFRMPIDSKVSDPRIKANECFRNDLKEYLRKAFPEETPSFDINFLSHNPEEVFVLNKGKITKNYQVVLMLIKEPA